MNSHTKAAVSVIFISSFQGHLKAPIDTTKKKEIRAHLVSVTEGLESSGSQFEKHCINDFLNSYKVVEVLIKISEVDGVGF